jgi:pilus assembly protein CpaC
MFRPFRLLALAGCLSFSALMASVPALAQAQITVAASSYGAQRNLNLELNKSMIVDLPAGVAEVIVSQPNVAAAIMRTRTRAIVQGIGGGDTNIFFLDDAGRTIQILDLRVIKEPSQVGNALEEALARVIPGSHITVESVTLKDETNRVVLSGTVASADDKARAEQVAVQFAGDPENVASILTISGAQQVMLQVTVSEVRREVARQLGINLSGSVVFGSVNLGFNNDTMTGTGWPTANAGTGSFPIGNVQLDAAIKALEQRDALRLLAQPTLTALSGESANFLVGGEVRYQSGTDDRGNPTYELREYGVKLDFTPVVKTGGLISIKVGTEVSEPDVGALLKTRKASTSVELPAGSTLAIGGLLDERVSRAASQLPGLGNIPILGALFRSNQYQTQQTELVILVTPYLVNPSPANTIAVPTDFSTPASDAAAIFLGKLENQYGVAGSGGMRGGFSGSVGFVLD